MPARNIVKLFDDNGYYHVYNRGVEKREVFLDDQDYRVFLSYFKDYLSPPEELGIKIFPSRKLKNYSRDIDLLCYCLMPNHFHLMIKQFLRTMMTGFMRSLLTRYSMYFNLKYKRVGSLFQSNYKAVNIFSEEQLVYLSRYIHRNPATSGSNPEVLKHEYSSLVNYLGEVKQSWIKHETVTDLFSKSVKGLTYRDFVLDSEVDDDEISSLLID